ncbi:MAG: UDP-3-O-(3-hydroxymyristoyl)glucosamine N-acyltransferase [Clostridiales bacterium]
MKVKIKEVADLVGGTLTGDENVFLENISKIEEALPGDLTFLYLPAYEKYFPTTKASAILVKTGFPKVRSDIAYIEVPSPNNALLKVINHFFKPDFNLQGIDQTAFIDPKASIGQNVSIGKNVVISSGCKIGDNVKIYHNCVLLDNVEIGNDCLIFPNVSIREKCRIGNNVIIHSGTVVGSDGFGYNPDKDGVYHKVPQIGIVIIEDDVELGANVCIDRASIGTTLIKQGTKIDNLVQVAHNVVIGENTAISAQSGISGSTKVGKNCIFAGQVGVAGHLEIVDRVIIAAQSGVSKSLTKSATYFGSPAKEHRHALKLEAHIRNLPEQSVKLKELENQLKELQEKFNKLSERGNF